jgi:hypothetical protein
MDFGLNPTSLRAHFCAHNGHDAIVFDERAVGARAAFRRLARCGVCSVPANLGLLGIEFILHDKYPEGRQDEFATAARGCASVSRNVKLVIPDQVDGAIDCNAAARATVMRSAGEQFWVLPIAASALPTAKSGPSMHPFLPRL